MDYLVKHLELALLDPRVRKSPERLSELLADDFFEFMQSGGSTTKQEVIAVLPHLPEEQFSVREYQEKILTPDMVLTHYAVDRFVPETGLKRCTLCSSLWRKRNGQWQMMFFQGTPAKRDENF